MMTRTMILALSLTAIAMPAAAQTEDRAAAVRIDDLNLARTADRDKLDIRLKSAARGVCHTGLRGTAESSRRAACVLTALARAEPQAKRAIAQTHSGAHLALLMVDAPH